MKRALFLMLALCVGTPEVEAQQSSRRTKPGTADQTSRPVSHKDLTNWTPVQAAEIEVPPLPEGTAAHAVAVPATLVRPPAELNSQQPPQPKLTTSINGSLLPKSTTASPTAPPVQPPVEPVRTSHSQAIVTEIIADPEINVGQTAGIQLKVTNQGNSGLSQVNLFLHLPDHVELTRAEPATIDRSGSIAAWQVDNLPAGETRTIQIDVVPNAKQSMVFRAEYSMVEQQELEIAVRQPEVKFAIESADAAIVGKELIYSVRIWNAGDGAATDLELSTGLAEGLQWVRAEDARIRIGRLNAGESRVVELATRATIGGTVPVQFHLTGDRVDLAQESIIPVVRPELYAELSGPNLNLPGREGQYSVQLKNPCPIAIEDARVVLQIPDGLEVTHVEKEARVDIPGRTISWGFASLEPGATRTVSYRARLTDHQTQTCEVVVQSRDTESINLAMETRAYLHSDLKLAMQNVSGPVSVGESVKFMVTATNDGPGAAEQVRIQVEYPEWMTPEPNEAYTIDPASRRLVFPAQDVPGNEQRTICFSGTCSHAGNFVVRGFLNEAGQSQTLVSDAGLFVLDMQTERVGSVTSGDVLQR